MHPAKSVIYFTTATGAGYGLLFWLAAFAAFDILPADQFFGFTAFGGAFFLVISGLLSSTLHLGHPERAWRALSQWRSSWLSREGIAAILTFLPTGLFACGWVFLGANTGWIGGLGLIGALLALITVYCTAMIYVPLKAVPAWNNPWVAPGYLAMSLGTGGLLLGFFAAIWDLPGLEVVLYVAMLFTGIGLIIKLSYWQSRTDTKTRSTSGTATGLSEFGTVRMVEGPHTETNYLLEEMGFQIGRKHAHKLRLISIVMGFALPIMAMGGALVLSDVSPVTWLVPATLTCAVGIVVERWLFFAEAQHVVTLYYGQERA